MPAQQKSVLITGCSSGIGLACASELHRRGYQVIATCRKPRHVQQINQSGITGILLDLDDANQVRQAASQALHLCGQRLYGLFHNAGYGLYGRLEHISREQLEQQFASNFFGVHQLTRLLLPAMLPHKAGRIIINSSVVGKVSTPGRGAYAASKHALEGWADSLRMELHGSGVQVSLIEPGPIQTAFQQNVQQNCPQQPVANTGMIQHFSLPPHAVVNKVCHALESRRPKVRYPVTIVAHSALLFQRLLPVRLFDMLARRSG